MLQQIVVQRQLAIIEQTIVQQIHSLGGTFMPQQISQITVQEALLFAGQGFTIVIQAMRPQILPQMKTMHLMRPDIVYSLSQ